jgi:methyl-accepting chemotaxis protein
MGYEKRTQYLIDEDFQKKFILRFCTIVVVSTIFIGLGIFVLSQNSMTVAIENTRVLVKPTNDFILPILIITLLGVALISAVIVVFMTLFASHKIAGPVFRMKREVELMINGELKRDFNIRDKDQFQGLAESLSKLSSYLVEKVGSVKSQSMELKSYLQERNYKTPDRDREKIADMFDQLEKTFEDIKID